MAARERKRGNVEQGITNAQSAWRIAQPPSLKLWRPGSGREGTSNTELAIGEQALVRRRRIERWMLDIHMRWVFIEWEKSKGGWPGD